MSYAWSDPGYEAVAALLGARAGFAFAPPRIPDVESSMRAAMKGVGVSGPGELAAVLASHPPAVDALIEALTVQESYFLRDPQHFAFLRTEVFPALQARPSPDQPIRVWSAGCSGGEEPYSLAILADQEGLLEKVVVVGTDVSQRALARARAATYGPWSLRGVDEAVVRRYFRTAGPQWKLVEQIRERVTFRRLNLAEQAVVRAHPAGASDIILCRNVLIYFDRTAVARVARTFYEALSEGGYLVTGPSDPSLADHAPFEVLVRPQGVFYRRPARKAAASSEPPGPPARVTSPPRRFGPPVALGRPRPAPHRPQPGPLHAAVAPAASRLPADPEEMSAAIAAVLSRARASGSASAVEACSDRLRRHPTSATLHLLLALLLVDTGQTALAADALKRALFLDHALPLGHFVRGTLLRQLGDVDGARRAFRNARELSAALPPDAALPLTDGETAGQLQAAADAALEDLGPSPREAR